MTDPVRVSFITDVQLEAGEYILDMLAQLAELARSRRLEILAAPIFRIVDEYDIGREQGIRY